jgi:hypothetical protein
MTAVRTLERGYHAATGRRPRQIQRVHIIREDGPKERGGSQAWCGAHARGVTNSPPIVREAPHALPAGLRWCPACIGHLAEQMGRLGEVARLLGAEAGHA